MLALLAALHSNARERKTKLESANSDAVEYGKLGFARERLRMVPSLIAGAGTGVPLFPGEERELALSRDGAIPSAEAGSW